jgi:hypothetical protein
MRSDGRKGEVPGNGGKGGGASPMREGYVIFRKGYTPLGGQDRPQVPETATGESPEPAATTQSAASDE